MDSLDRAAVECDSPDDHDNDRILHTTDASSQPDPASTSHVSTKSQFKKKAREILHINNFRPAVTEPVDGVTLAPSPNPATLPFRLDKHPPKDGLAGLKDFAHQPVQTIKAKVERKTNREVAENLVTAEISHAHDVELVRAQDRMALATTDEERLSACQDLEVLKKARQDMFVRWTMDRHVLKIRQLERTPIQHRARAEFITKDEYGQGKMDWKAYGGHVRSIQHGGPPRDRSADRSMLCSSWLFYIPRNMAASILARLLNHPLQRKKPLAQASRGS